MNQVIIRDVKVNNRFKVWFRLMKSQCHREFQMTDEPRFSISAAEKSMVLTATHAGKATFPPCLVVPMAILGHKRSDLPEDLRDKI